MVRDFQRICLWAALLLFISNYGGVGAGDIVHDDNLAPKKPGCENDFVLVISQFCFFSCKPAYFTVIYVVTLFICGLIPLRFWLKSCSRL